MSHTPTPYAASWNDDLSWVGVDCGNDSDPHVAQVCTICLENILEDDEVKAFERAKEDAVFIANACNAHDDLVAALETCREMLGEYLRTCTDDNDQADMLDTVITQSESALKQAKGE